MLVKVPGDNERDMIVSYAVVTEETVSVVSWILILFPKWCVLLY